MAAIFGLIGQHRPEQLELMADRLQHRGSARQLENQNERVSVGAIGEDPGRMIVRTETGIAVASGRLYGFRDGSANADSRDSLAERLYRRFHSYGVAGLAGLDGDFAAVICPLDASRVTFLRDFFGCRPLFWSAIDEACIAFASEYKAILALEGFKPSVDRSMLQHLQATKRLPVGRTLLANVRSVTPGATTVAKGSVATVEPYQALVADVRIRDEETARKLVSTRFREATRRRAGTSAPLGLALSGGIDSISVAFYLREMFPDRKIHTFSAGYGDSDPEMITALEVARQIEAVHHPVQTPPSLLLSSLKKLVWHMEDPTSRSEALQLMRIGEVASEHVPFLLSGQGADGLFAGMPRHRLIGMIQRLPLARGALFEILDLTQSGIQPYSMIGKALAVLLHRGHVPVTPTVLGAESVVRPERIKPGRDFLNRMLAASYQSSTFQDIGKFERTFGASGLKYASPFLDVAFAEAAFTIDERLKINKGIDKYILRSALSPVVPQEYRFLPKHPQRMHYDSDFAACLDQAADEYLSPASVRSRGFFTPESINRLRRRDRARPYAAEPAMQLWTAITTEIWARLFLDSEPL